MPYTVSRTQGRIPDGVGSLIPMVLMSRPMVAVPRSAAHGQCWGMQQQLIHDGSNNQHFGAHQSPPIQSIHTVRPHVWSRDLDAHPELEGDTGNPNKEEVSTHQVMIADRMIPELWKTDIPRRLEETML